MGRLRGTSRRQEGPKGGSRYTLGTMFVLPVILEVPFGSQRGHENPNVWYQIDMKGVRRRPERGFWNGHGKGGEQQGNNYGF